MRRNPAVLALGVAGLLMLAACTSDKQGSVPLAASPTTTSTTSTAPSSTAPSTTASTTAAPGLSSTVPKAPVTTAPRPVVVDGVPQVTATPSTAAIGARVRIEGAGFTDPNWRQAGATLWLSATYASCNLVAEVAHTVEVTAAGHLAGEFTVPGTGVCRQSDLGERPLSGGRYRIAFQCTACTIGELEITAPASLRCNNVGFSPNSDNLASDIVATGVSCADAEALVRKVGGPLGPINGAPRAEADGWTCVRTTQSDRGLPSATYECTNGARTITFVRT